MLTLQHTYLPIHIPLERFVRGIVASSNDWAKSLILFGFWRVSILTLLFFLAWMTSAHAKETPSIESFFTSTTAKITTTSNAVNVPVEWTYTHSPDRPLVVEKIDESCGCLAGNLDQKVIENGTGGVIRATFTPGGYRGIVRKSLHVRFVGYEKSVELIVEATIPSSVELSNKELSWAAGSETKTQTIDVTTGTAEDFNITALQGVPESLFQITQEIIVPKRHYRIHITPLGANAPNLQTLQIRTDSKDTRDQVIAVFLRHPGQISKEVTHATSPTGHPTP